MTYTAEQKLAAVERMIRNVTEAVRVMPSPLSDRGKAYADVLRAIADDYRAQVAKENEK